MFLSVNHEHTSTTRYPICSPDPMKTEPDGRDPTTVTYVLGPTEWWYRYTVSLTFSRPLLFLYSLNG